MDETSKTAKPLPGTLVQFAECANCGAALERRSEVISRRKGTWSKFEPWHHAHTGKEQC